MEISNKLKNIIESLEDDDQIQDILDLICKEKELARKGGSEGVIKYLQGLESTVLCNDDDKYLLRKILILLQDKFENELNEDSRYL